LAETTLGLDARCDRFGNRRFTFFGFPLRIRGGHGSPVRAVAIRYCCVHPETRSITAIEWLPVGNLPLAMRFDCSRIPDPVTTNRRHWRPNAARQIASR